MFLKSIFSTARLIVIAVVVILYIHYFIPQSWGFFTLEPRQPLYNAYMVQDGIAGSRMFTNNMNYGMGVSRKGLVLFNTLLKIVDKNKNLQWKRLNEDSLLFLTKYGTYTVVLTGDPQSIYKGRFLFTKIDRPADSTLMSRHKFFVIKQYILADVR